MVKQVEQEQKQTNQEQMIEYANTSYSGIERKLKLCKVPEHEHNEIMQMVIAYAEYCHQALMLD